MILLTPLFPTVMYVYIIMIQGDIIIIIIILHSHNEKKQLKADMVLLNFSV